jgi:hypothetical protein
MLLRFRLWLMISFLVLLAISPVFAQDAQGDVYVEAIVDDTNPYIGQQIIYTFKLYDAVGLTNPLYQPSDFEGFWRVDIGVLSQTFEQINGRQYTVTTLATALYPTQSGEVTIKPSSVVLPETVFRSKTTLTANPLSLNVQTLPVGQPADFGGAVGQFNISAALDRQSVNQGEPVTMTLTVSGTGNVEQLPPPAVSQDWRSTVNAENYSSELQNGIIVGKRDYQIVFFPTTAGKQSLPPITLNYFDSEAGVYRSVGTSPVEIEVLGSSSGTASQSVAMPEASLKLKPISNEIVNDSNLSMSAFMLLMLLPLLVVFASFGWQRTKTKRQRQQILLRQQQALQVAKNQLDHLTFSDTQSTYEQVSRIIQKYVADKLNIDLLNTNKLDILTLMDTTGAPKSVIDNMTALIQHIDEGLFAPSTQVISLSRREEITKLLAQIDHQWIKQ